MSILLKNNNNLKYKTEVVTAEDLNKNIEFLQQALKQIRDDSKKTSVYDYYNIQDSANTEDEIKSKIVALLPNSGLIINCKTADYNKGDILIKQDDGSIIRIEAETQGLYYPARIEEVAGNTPTYNITYNYSRQTLTESRDIEVGSIADGAYNSITFTGLKPIEANLYNATEKKYEGPIEVENINDARPIVSCFYDNEPFECEVRIVKKGDKWEITLPDNVKTIGVMVVIR